MTEIQPQLPERLSALNKKERSKVLKQCDKTHLCISDAAVRPLTEKDVVAALGVRRAIVLPDESTGGFWVRAGDDEHNLFLERLFERGLPGYTARTVDRGGEEWRRLVEKLIDHGQSPLQDQTEEANEPKSTSDLVDAQVGDGSVLSADECPEVGSPGSGLIETSLEDSSSEDDEDSDSDVDSTTEPELERPRKRARLTPDDALEVAPSTSSASGIQEPIPQLGLLFAKLPSELMAWIFELCLEDATTFKAYHRTLRAILKLGGRYREILTKMPSVWTKITSIWPNPYTRMCLAFSQNRLIHVEGGPGRAERFNEFISIIKPHKDRMATLKLRFPSNLWGRIKNMLADPIPSLVTLSLSLEDAALQTGLALPLGDALTGEIGRPLDILGGETENLQRVFFKHIPSFWDPRPFTSLLELGLDNGTHIRYADLTSFLRHSPNLQTLHLANIKFVGGVAHIVAETILLPRLTKLVLAEEIEPLGLGGLYLSLTAPECNILRLDLRTPMGFIGNVGFAERVGPTVQRVLARNKTSSLLFGSHINTQSASWTSEDEDRRGSNEHPLSFDISFRSRDVDLASVFSTFVRGFQTSLEGLGDMVVDVGHSASGAIANPLGLDLEAVVPTLSPGTFEGFPVVEVRADVVDGCLQHLKGLMVPRESEGWSFGVLKTVRLYAIPKESLETPLDESAGCCLEEFISDVRHKRYGIRLHEPRPEEMDPMTFILEGTFAVQREMARALEKGNELWGIEVDHSNAFLVYPGDEEKKVEEKKGEKEED
ncbi:hypothetical protein FRC01_011552 [Tulasnella sp. 417]|nr:hypothetical protein FRC01_011552 [Tulasnella sp. 417]